MKIFKNKQKHFYHYFIARGCLVLLAFTVSCAKRGRLRDVIYTTDSNLPQNQKHDPTFNRYLEAYERYSGRSTSSVFVELVNLEHPIIGTCTRFNNGKRIQIDVDYYNQNKGRYYCIEVLMFHELGHCLQNRGHYDVEYLGEPMSVMRSAILACGKYRKWRKGYIEELLDQDEGRIMEVIFDSKNNID